MRTRRARGRYWWRPPGPGLARLAAWVFLPPSAAAARACFFLFEVLGSARDPGERPAPGLGIFTLCPLNLGASPAQCRPTQSLPVFGLHIP